MATLSDLGEFGLIKRFSRQFSKDLPEGITGIGDDTAVIPLNEKEALLITTDMLIEDSHFLMDKIPPYDLGQKSLSVNLSDIAAMGGSPHSAYLAIGIPAKMEIKWLDNFFLGIKDLCSETKTYFLGGDTTRSPERLVINICVIGTIHPTKIKRRSTAMQDDIICVNDSVGDSGGGLKILVDQKPLDKHSSYLVQRHNCPRAHIEEGKWLAQREEINAMIDVSDGIESDIHRIMESSDVGAEIEINKIPLSEQLIKVSEKYNWNAREISLTSGEDYCLMFTVPENYINNVEKDYVQEFKRPLHKIGKITGKQGKLIITRDGKAFDFNKHGFDHFKQENEKI
jgi:thiamine-monophosphate kinase